MSAADVAAGNRWAGLAGAKRSSQAPAQPLHGDLLLVGLSYRTAPAAVRDRLAAAGQPDGAVAAAIRALGPAVVLWTCNRTELYIRLSGRPGARASAGAGMRGPARRALRLLASHAGLAVADLQPYVYVKYDGEAARHLMRVAAGLDSLVLGEAQIQGQVRSAWLRARGEAPLDPAFDGLFRRAIMAGKRIRSCTGLSNHPSVASIAAQVTIEELAGASGKIVAVVGAGSTGKLAAWSLLQAGARVVLVNRSAERAAAAAATLATACPSDDPGAVTTAPLDQLAAVLSQVDAAISAVAAPDAVVTTPMLAAALERRAGRPLVLVDVGAPRNVAPAAKELPGVRLLDLDDLARRCPAGLREQREQLARAEAMAAAAAAEYVAWCGTRAAVPAITALREHAAGIRDAELRRAARRLSSLSPRDWHAVEVLASGIVNKLLHAPTIALREAGARGCAQDYGQAIADLFSPQVGRS